MKKIFFSALAALSLAACVQEAMVDVPQSDAIAFEDAFIDNATRAAVDPSFNINTLNAFNVWAYVNAPDGVVFEGTEVSRTGMGAPWTYEGTQYWAPGQQYNFEAIAPVDGNWTLATNHADPTVLSFENADGTEDLLYATAQQTGAAIGSPNQTVKFSFNHILSKVKFTFNNGFLTDNVTVKVTDIKMVAPKKAQIDLSKESEMAWENATETLSLEFGDVEDLTLAVNSNECADERFTIPGQYDYTITFDLEIVMGAQTVYDVEKTSTVKGVELEMGKAYNFVAEISPATLDFEAIEFKVVEIEDWNTSGAPSNDSQVAGSELQAAAQLGGTYKLTKDVVVDAPVVIPAGVDFVLNLNGKTIKNTTQSNVYGEGEGIIAYGNLIINGEGTVEGSTMAVWARGNDGAKVTINGGTYKGCAGDYEGGRAVIYASSGNVIDIYGGTFEALAADETSFAKTEYPVLNVADNNGMINVYGGTFVGQNPAAPGTEPAAWNAAHPNGFVADGYSTVLKGSGYVVVRQIVADLFDVTENTEVTFTENLPVSNGTTIHTQGATADITIEGNGMSVVSTADSAEDFQWEGGRFPSMSTILSSEDGSLVTVNDLTFEGTMSALMLGHYVDSKSNWYNTELNNVNVVNAEVVSFSQNIAPAVCIYGTATLNNCEIYGTTLSELDTDPMWPVYDVAAVNYSSTTIKGGKIGSFFLWNQAKLFVEAGAVIDTIVIRGNMNVTTGCIDIKAGAEVKAIDLSNITNKAKLNIIIEDGATLGKIVANGVEYSSLAEYLQ